MGGVLCLDVATQTGWAYGSTGDAPRHGTYRAPSTGDDLGRFAYSFLQWLTGKLRELEPKEIVFEAPILPRNTNITVLKKLYGLALMVELAAMSEGIPCSEIAAGTWRRGFLGAHYPRKATRDELKRAVVSACRAYGWEPNSTDDADALGILHVVLSHSNPRWAAASTVARMEAA